MSAPPVPRPGKARLARVALRLYPPAWRARYRAEVLALLDDTGGGLAAALGLAWRALPAWIWPPWQLHDRDARMRASLGTVLAAGAMLAGVCLVFAQLTQFQGFRAHGSAVVAGSYAIFDAAMAVCALAAAAGGLPLWLVMLRRARREHRVRETAYLMLPVVAPAAYLATVATVARLLGGPGRRQRWSVLRGDAAGLWRGSGGVRRAHPDDAAAAPAGPGCPARRAGCGSGDGGHRGGCRGQCDRTHRTVPVGARLRRLPQRRGAERLSGSGCRTGDGRRCQRAARHPGSSF
ncbi:MAG TPA: hypothetical protein VGH53_23520 [Streptosporangiaceae bacterium]